MPSCPPPLKHTLHFAAAALTMAALAAQGQPLAQQPALASPTTVAGGGAAALVNNSALDAESFYEVLLGELDALGGKPGTGHALLLNAARRTNDPRLYQRAVELALQSRSGDAALQAARAWRQAQPASREANRYLLQILLALNRIGDTTDLLRREIALAPEQTRPQIIATLPFYYERVSDKALAARAMERALADYAVQPDTGAAAWSSIGRLRHAAGDINGALEAARRGQALDARAEGPALLALELMAPGPKTLQAEAIVKRYLAGQPLPEVRLGYARALLGSQRYTEALQQLRMVTTGRPDYAPAWLVQGTLQARNMQDADAQASLERYLKLIQATAPGVQSGRELSQAYLALARLAKERKDYPGAETWLNKVSDPQEIIGVQAERASILARQGKFAEARQLIRDLPERDPAETREKLTAEVQLLLEDKQNQAAYDLLTQALQRTPEDVDMLYDRAILAGKLNRPDEMERLLRQIIAKRPDFHHAYNALGYSLVERNVQLPEARRLIRKALEYAPDDPIIMDSLGWLEFRLGNQTEALRILENAYQANPDPAIAAHLGETLWLQGQRGRAITVWKEGLLRNNGDEVLQETLRRLHVKP